jgi:neutral ceramidase
MQAGIARVEITPPPGVDLTGFIAREGPCSGVHDPLYATALVVEDRGERIALVSCDLIGLGRRLVERVRRAVVQACGILPDCQMYCCTHTHGGPETGVIAGIGLPDPAYLARLETTLVGAVTQAAAELQPVRLRWAAGEEPQAALNRVGLRTGTDRPIDPQVAVLRIDTAAGQPLCSVVHYTCHPTAVGHGSTLATADYVYYLRDELEPHGSGPVVYLNGAGGDINPCMDGRGYAAAERAGRAIGRTARCLWEAAAPLDASGVAGRRAELRLELALLPDFDHVIALAREGQERLAGKTPLSPDWRAAHVVYVQHAARLVRLLRGSEPLPEYTAEIQVLRIGPAGIAALPGEFFVALGLALKARSPVQPLLVAGWSNDNIGYVPDRASYPLGGYEIDVAYRYYGYPAVWAPGTGEAAVELALRLLHELPQAR